MYRQSSHFDADMLSSIKGKGHVVTSTFPANLDNRLYVRSNSPPTAMSYSYLPDDNPTIVVDVKSMISAFMERNERDGEQ